MSHLHLRPQPFKCGSIQKSNSVWRRFTPARAFPDAVNIFIQQSLNMEGLPFLASPENAEYMKAKAMRRLLDEAEKGWASAEKDGWVSEEDAYRTLGVTE